MRRLLIVRHGETEENIARTIQGHTDGTLTTEGKLQAEILAERLTHEKVDLLYSSDLGRARHTAECISAKLGIRIIFDVRLREKTFGALDGRPYSEYRSILEEFGGPELNFAAPDGESFVDLFRRTSDFIDDILATEQFNTCLVVAHGGSIRGMLHKLLSMSPESAMELRQDNCCLNEILLGESGTPTTAKVLNCVAHLGEP